MSNVTKPIEDHTRADQTRYLSREFIIGFIFNLIVVLGGGFYVVGRIEAKADMPPPQLAEVQAQVAVLKSHQVDGERVAKLEEAMKNLESSLARVQAALDRNFYGDGTTPRKK